MQADGSARIYDTIVKQPFTIYNILALCYPHAMIKEPTPILDRITKETLLPLLGSERLQNVLCFPSTDSTNLRLQEIAQKEGVRHGCVAVAEAQTAGRGRLGRTFSTLSQQGVYLSILLDPSRMGSVPALTDWTALTSWAAVAACDAIEIAAGIRPQIKWVNDLFLRGRKVGGILTQMETAPGSTFPGHIILGIGINVQEEKEGFPEELRDSATSLYLEMGKKTPRAALAAELIRQLDTLCDTWPAAQARYLEQYRKDSLVVGKEILVLSGNAARHGVALSIGDDFALRVRYANNTEEDLRGGEISLRLPNP